MELAYFYFALCFDNYRSVGCFIVPEKVPAEICQELKEEHSRKGATFCIKVQRED